MPLRRTALLATFLLEVVTVALVWLACMPARAYAYVDPSVMTYTIQALAGVAVALSAVAGVVFRRIRRRLLKSLNIDENANKAVEGDVSRIDPASQGASVRLMEADDRAERLREESAANSESRGLAGLTWPKRLAFSALMCLFAFFIMLAAPAVEIFGANSDSLVFGLQSVWWIAVAFNVLFATAAAFALSLLKGKTFMRAMLIVFCLAFASYVQSFFMNSGMMPADGGFIGWHEWYFVRKMISSGIVWLAIMIVPQILCRNHRYAWLKATSFVAVAVIVMQGVGVASVAVDASKDSDGMDERPYVTQGDLYTVSPKDNIIVFVLDTYDTQLLEEIRSGDSEALSEFSGFTYYPDSAGVMIPTQNAVPYLLTDSKPEPGQDLDEYRSLRYEKGTLLPAIYDSGYSIDVYTDSAMLDMGREADRETARIVGNIHRLGKVPVDAWSTYLAMCQMAMYREAPWFAKPLFWYYTTDVNNRMIGESGSGDMSGHDELYELDDAGILKTLRERGLQMTDVGLEGDIAHENAGGIEGNGGSGSKGAFKFIHLFGPHFPFNVDEDGNRVPLNLSDQLRQAKGSMKVVEQYLSELKRLGLYDGATIIVTADHGIWDEHEDPVMHASSPIMLVKPKTEPGGSDAPCAVSDVPVSHTDLAPTVMAAIGADPSGYGSGSPIWDIKDKGRVRYFDLLNNSDGNGRRFIEYQIDGEVVDLDSWSKTGAEWPGA